MYRIILTLAFLIPVTTGVFAQSNEEAKPTPESMEDALQEMTKALDTMDLNALLSQGMSMIQGLDGTGMDLKGLGLTDSLGNVQGLEGIISQLMPGMENMDMGEINKMMEQSMKMMQGMDMSEFQKLFEGIDMEQFEGMMKGFDMEQFKEMIPAQPGEAKPNETKDGLKKI